MPPCSFLVVYLPRCERRSSNESGREIGDVIWRAAAGASESHDDELPGSIVTHVALNVGGREKGKLRDEGGMQQ